MEQGPDQKPSTHETKEAFAFAIAEATPEDSRDIWQIQYESSLDALSNQELGITRDEVKTWYPDFGPDGNLTENGEEKLAKEIERLKSEPPTDSKAYLAKDGDTAAGFITVSRSSDRNRLVGIYTRPGYEGKGLGTQLWNAGSEFFDPSKDTVVSLMEYNLPARMFYTKLGFEETGEVRDGDITQSGAQTKVIDMVRRAQRTTP